jgi:hypothetical protein
VAWSMNEIALYRGEYVRSGVRSLDGARPRDEACAEVAEGGWRLLVERGRAPAGLTFRGSRRTVLR